MGSGVGSVWKVDPDSGAFSRLYDTGWSLELGGLAADPNTRTLGFGGPVLQFYRVPLDGSAPSVYDTGGALSTPSFDRETGLIFAGSEDGRVYGF